MGARINQTVLMSGTKYFSVEELNPYAKAAIQPDRSKAASELKNIRAALEDVGVTVVSVPEPRGCPDGIFTAN